MFIIANGFYFAVNIDRKNSSNVIDSRKMFYPKSGQTMANETKEKSLDNQDKCLLRFLRLSVARPQATAAEAHFPPNVNNVKLNWYEITDWLFNIARLNKQSIQLSASFSVKYLYQIKHQWIRSAKRLSSRPSTKANARSRPGLWPLVCGLDSTQKALQLRTIVNWKLKLHYRTITRIKWISDCLRQRTRRTWLLSAFQRPVTDE